MIRKTLLTTALATIALASLAWTPPAQSQTQRMMCVDLTPYTGNARVVIEQLDESGGWSQLLYVVTVPVRRCAYTTRNLTTRSGAKVRFTVEAHENGGFRMLCRGESAALRDATMVVTPAGVGGASCIVRE